MPGCRRRWRSASRNSWPAAPRPSPTCRSSSSCATSGATSRTTRWPISDFYLEQFAANVERAGGHVHWCSTADEAREAVLGICRAVGARTVTKGKSMISEELGINAHLEAQRRHAGRDRSRRIHHPAPRRDAEPHHRARLPPEPGGLGGAVPPVAHRPAGGPRVRRAARHPDRGAAAAAGEVPRRRCRHHRRQFPDRRDRQQRDRHQ